MQQRRVSPWQLWNFRRRGRLWPHRDENDIAAWPAEAVVCQCAQVTRGALGHAIAQGCASLDAIGQATRAATACGSCRPLVMQLLARGTPVPPVRGARVLAGGAALALLVAAAALQGWNLPDPRSVAEGSAAFWREADFKQLSGYALIAAVLLSLALTWRKRARRQRSGDTAMWRVAHVALALLAGLTLLLHTGGRIGVNLNLALSATFLAALVLGAFSALSVAREHLGFAAVQRRRRMVWVHLACTWPAPGPCRHFWSPMW